MATAIVDSWSTLAGSLSIPAQKPMNAKAAATSHAVTLSPFRRAPLRNA